MALVNDRRAPDTRRGFLRMASIAVGGVVLGGAPVARAVTPLAADDYHAVLKAACGPSGEHAAIIAAVAKSAGLAIDDPALQPLLQNAACPLCGCPVITSAAGTPF